MVIVNEKKFTMLCTVLKYMYGVVTLIIGLDKFFYFIVDWSIYVSPMFLMYAPRIIALNIIPIAAFMDISAGLLILSKWTRFGAYLIASWICVIGINLYTMGLYDIMLRDMIIALGYVTLGVLIRLRETSRPV